MYYKSHILKEKKSDRRLKLFAQQFSAEALESADGDMEMQQSLNISTSERKAESCEAVKNTTGRLAREKHELSNRNMHKYYCK